MCRIGVQARERWVFRVRDVSGNLAHGGRISLCSRRRSAGGGACSDLFPAPVERRCSAGFTCWHGTCRPYCERDTDCRRGRCIQKSPMETVCASDVCLTDKDCSASNSRCTEFRDGSPSTCARLAEGACRPGTCPQDQACDASLDGDKLVGKCRKMCDQSRRQCDATEACRAPFGTAVDNVSLPSGLCYKRCAFSAPNSCGTGETCGTLGGDPSVTVCRPITAAMLLH